MLAYSAMRTHWHFVLWPQPDANLPRFMHGLTMQHAQRWHRHRGTEGTGHVYQDRYKSVAIENDDHLLTALRYVERNALSAGIVPRAEEWRWCSLWRRQHHCERPLLSEWPFPVPQDWLESLNRT